MGFSTACAAASSGTTFRRSLGWRNRWANSAKVTTLLICGDVSGSVSVTAALNSGKSPSDPSAIGPWSTATGRSSRSGSAIPSQLPAARNSEATSSAVREAPKSASKDCA